MFQPPHKQHEIKVCGVTLNFSTIKIPFFWSTVVFGEKVMKNGSNPLQKFITL